MPLPYRFLSGEKAASGEVNANFDYIMNTIGQLSGPTGIVMVGEFRFGPRGTGIFSAKQDTASAENSHLQIGWNINWEQVNGVWKFGRYINGGRGAALRLGHRGFEFFYSASQYGELNSQMVKYFSFGQRTYDRMFFLRDDVHIQNHDGDARSQQDFRLTTVFFHDPIAIYNEASVSKGKTLFDAYNLGVPKYAKGILVYCHVTAATRSGAAMYIYKSMPVEPAAINRFRGLVVHSTSGERAGVQGMVPLGEANQAGQFIVDRTEKFSNANVYIIGYLT